MALEGPLVDAGADGDDGTGGSGGEMAPEGIGDDGAVGTTSTMHLACIDRGGFRDRQSTAAWPGKLQRNRDVGG